MESVDKMLDNDIEKPAGTFYLSEHLQKRPVSRFSKLLSMCQLKSKRFKASIFVFRNKNESLSVSAVIVLRILKIKLDKPELYENTIAKMEDNLTILEEKTSWQEYVDDIIDPVINLEIENVNRIDVKKIVGVLLTNAFETTSAGNNDP